MNSPADAAARWATEVQHVKDLRTHAVFIIAQAGAALREGDNDRDPTAGVAEAIAHVRAALPLLEYLAQAATSIRDRQHLETVLAMGAKGIG